METRFINDHDVAYYRALVADKFGDCEDDDWWHAFDRYDINVTLTDSGDAWKATLYLCNEQMNDTLTDRWQSLGIIKHKQKGKSMETTNEIIEQPKSLHSDLLRIGQLEKTVEGLRARIDRDVARFDEFVKNVDAFLKGMVEEYNLEETDLVYRENLKEWVDRDVLTNYFMSEVTYRVEVTITKTLEVTVKHPSDVGDIDVEDMLEAEFGSVDGDEDAVSDYLDDDQRFEITDISTWSRDVEVEAKAK